MARTHVIWTSAITAAVAILVAVPMFMAAHDAEEKAERECAEKSDFLGMCGFMAGFEQTLVALGATAVAVVAAAVAFVAWLRTPVRDAALERAPGSVPDEPAAASRFD